MNPYMPSPSSGLNGGSNMRISIFSSVDGYDFKGDKHEDVEHFIASRDEGKGDAPETLKVSRARVFVGVPLGMGMKNVRKLTFC